MWKPAPLETADIPRWDVVVESPIQVMSPGMTEEVGAPETSIDETNDLSCWLCQPKLIVASQPAI